MHYTCGTPHLFRCARRPPPLAASRIGLRCEQLLAGRADGVPQTDIFDPKVLLSSVMSEFTVSGPSTEAVHPATRKDSRARVVPPVLSRSLSEAWDAVSLGRKLLPQDFGDDGVVIVAADEEVPLTRRFRPDHGLVMSLPGRSESARALEGL